MSSIRMVFSDLCNLTVLRYVLSSLSVIKVHYGHFSINRFLTLNVRYFSHSNSCVINIRIFHCNGRKLWANNTVLQKYSLKLTIIANAFLEYIVIKISCRAWHWRQNESNGVSNHRRVDCLPNHLFRRRSNKTSKLRTPGLCAGNSPVTGEFPAQRASNAKIFLFDDVIMDSERRMESFSTVWDLAEITLYESSFVSEVRAHTLLTMHWELKRIDFPVF